MNYIPTCTSRLVVVKAEKKLTYGEARRLVKASSPSPASAPSSYANAVRSTQRKSVECQTPDFWMQDKPSLLSLSKLPSILTTSTGFGTETHISPTKGSKQKEHVNKNPSQDRTVTNSKSLKTQSTPANVVKTGNKFLSLSPDVEHMEEDSPQWLLLYSGIVEDY